MRSGPFVIVWYKEIRDLLFNEAYGSEVCRINVVTNFLEKMEGLVSSNSTRISDTISDTI